MYSPTGSFNNPEFESWRQIYRYSVLGTSRSLLLNTPGPPATLDPPDTITRLPSRTPRFIAEAPHVALRSFKSQLELPSYSYASSSSEFTLTSPSVVDSDQNSVHSSELSTATAKTEHMADLSISELRGMILALQHKTEGELDEVRHSIYTEMMNVYTITNRLRKLIFQNNEVTMTRLYVGNLASTDLRLLVAVPITGPLVGQYSPFTFSFIYTGAAKLIIKASGHLESHDLVDLDIHSIDEAFSSEVVLDYDFRSPSFNGIPPMLIMQGRIVHLFTGIEVSITIGETVFSKRISLDQVSFIEFYTLAAIDNTVTLTEVCTYPVAQVTWEET